jgi:hypothetical protein
MFHPDNNFMVPGGRTPPMMLLRWIEIIDHFQDKFTIDNRIRQNNKRHRRNGKFLFLYTIKAIPQTLYMKGVRFLRLAQLGASIVILTACSVAIPEQKMNVIPENGQIAGQKRAMGA